MWDQKPAPPQPPSLATSRKGPRIGVPGQLAGWGEVHAGQKCRAAGAPALNGVPNELARWGNRAKAGMERAARNDQICREPQISPLTPGFCPTRLILHPAQTTRPIPCLRRRCLLWPVILA